jgi:AcrR family transcriptional regulator
VAPATETVALSREVIVRQALAVADREGLAAVSMRRVGAELGYSGMSLYRYVANKEELLGLLVDHVLGTVPDLDDTAPWRTAVIDFFVALHDALLTHPAVARLASENPVQGPNTLRHGRRALAVLRGGGLPDRLAVESFIALSCYTIGAAMYSVGRAPASEASRAGWVGFGSTPSDGATELDALHAHLVARTSSAQFRSGLEHLVSGYAADADGT